MRRCLLLGWALSSLREASGLGYAAVAAGLEQPPDAWLQVVQHERERIQAYATRNGGIKPKTFRSAKDAATAHGRLESWTYSLAHEMVHGSDLAFLFSRRKLDSNVFAIHIRTPDSEVEVGVACFCAESLLHAAVAYTQILSCPGSSELQTKLSEIEQLQERLVANRAKQTDA
jgi:hypothetical protein